MKTLFYFSLIFLIVSCGGSGTSEPTQTASSPDDSLFSIVMHEHDVAMLKQRQIPAIQKKIDSLATGKSASLREEYKSLNVELQSAYDGMNKWMDEIRVDTLQDQPAERAEYFSSEEKKITKVKNDILSALAKADSVLKK